MVMMPSVMTGKKERGWMEVERERGSFSWGGTWTQGSWILGAGGQSSEEPGELAREKEESSRQETSNDRQNRTEKGTKKLSLEFIYELTVDGKC
ncbi:hypothetical protein CDL15_Pgr017497 [Punica granatum]|uniref:Uncharacterized protein n=1 Tax=Punica granatum TaxID=22663 RepID=A0A218WZ05_PUNGR|nr:hypothetical protein CDL15_Pgr017497 [Punica granatum]